MAPVIDCGDLLLEVGESGILLPALTLEGGKLYRVLGNAASGAGEFLQLLAGLAIVLESSRPARGSRVMRENLNVSTVALRPLRFLGEPLFDIPTKTRARQIGFIWEEPEASFLGSRVREEYWYQPAALGVSPLPSLWGLREFGLYEMRDQETFTLSGGEKHRLNVASVFALDRRLVVADFGSSNLDADFETELLGRLREAMSQGTAVVIRGLEYREDVEECQWITVAGGEVAMRGASAPPEWRSAHEDREALRGDLRPRTNGGVVLVLDALQPQFAPGRLTYEVREGELVVVRGRNGVGKTSLGRAVVNPRSNVAGGGRQLASGTHPMMSLQSVAHTFLRRSVREELSGDEELTELCGLTKRADEHPIALNKSEQKLLSLATTLKQARRLAIIDEPTCGLDFDAKRKVVALLNAFPSLAVMILTHDAALEGLGTVLEMR